MSDLELLVTLWPTFSHFSKFAIDDRLAGVRLNSAMIHTYELDHDFALANSIKGSVPLWFDIKGRQLRVTAVENHKDHLELLLNHPITVETPTPVLFKAGEDYVELLKAEGNRLVFDKFPYYNVHEGESLHIRNPSLIVQGPTFCPVEVDKMAKAGLAGFTNYFLSYVENQKDVDEFRDYVGKDSNIILKIENLRGLEYVANEYKTEENVHLMAARGDLYVELKRPHHMLDAMKTIINKDFGAYVGSRLLLSLVNDSVPSCADLSDVAWLYDLGFKKMMLCDEICLKDDLLSRAVNTFESIRSSYASNYVAVDNP